MADSPNGAEVPSASVGESARFVVWHLLPNYLQGLFSRRPKWVGRLASLDVDRRSTELLSSIRERTDAEVLWVLGGKMLLVFGREPIAEVLDNSGTRFGSDSGAKKKGMCHFQPHAVTISTGEEWKQRRAFNEAVLCTAERVHPLADRFAAIAAEETALAVQEAAGDLRWEHIDTLHEKMMLRVVFGDRARDDHQLVARLQRLMHEANRVAALSESDDFEPFHQALRDYLSDPPEDCLLGRAAKAPEIDDPAGQIPHWMFAMGDTLALNVAQAVIAVLSQPEVEATVHDELEGADLDKACDVDGLRQLEGCLEEAMRLWPTTPVLARESMCEQHLAGAKLSEGTPVMIVNTFNHRDSRTVADADHVVPERWRGSERDPRFNHLSGGSQICAGIGLTVFLGKAVLATLLRDRDLKLREPQLAEGPLPHKIDPFSLRVGVEPS
ncbi:MAG: cytochrome P450 [Solirubrobacterales bacterium]